MFPFNLSRAEICSTTRTDVRQVQSTQPDIFMNWKWNSLIKVLHIIPLKEECLFLNIQTRVSVGAGALYAVAPLAPFGVKVHRLGFDWGLNISRIHFPWREQVTLDLLVPAVLSDIVHLEVLLRGGKNEKDYFALCKQINEKLRSSPPHGVQYTTMFFFFTFYRSFFTFSTWFACLNLVA